MKKNGLTTTKAPLIERVREAGELFTQESYYDLYNEDNQEAWKKIYCKLSPLWEKYASSKFLKGVKLLNLTSDKIPNLSDVNKSLESSTGFKLKAVSGYLLPGIFFDCLKKDLSLLQLP